MTLYISFITELNIDNTFTLCVEGTLRTIITNILELNVHGNFLICSLSYILCITLDYQTYNMKSNTKSKKPVWQKIKV